MQRLRSGNTHPNSWSTISIHDFLVIPMFFSSYNFLSPSQNCHGQQASTVTLRCSPHLHLSPPPRRHRTQTSTQGELWEGKGLNHCLVGLLSACFCCPLRGMSLSAWMLIHPPFLSANLSDLTTYFKPWLTHFYPVLTNSTFVIMVFDWSVCVFVTMMSCFHVFTTK